jgi:hypothetical protein
MGQAGGQLDERGGVYQSHGRRTSIAPPSPTAFTNTCQAGSDKSLRPSSSTAPQRTVAQVRPARVAEAAVRHGPD